MPVRRPEIENVLPRPEPPPKPKPKKKANINTRHMPPEEVAKVKVKVLAALALNNYNVSETARKFKVRNHTIQKWIKDDREAVRRVTEEADKNMRDGIQKRWEEERPLREAQRQAQDDENTKAVRQVVTLSLEGMAALANELVASMRADLKEGGKPIKFYDRGWVLGVVFDKMQVATGNPTSITGRTEHLGMSRHQRFDQLMEAAEERKLKLVQKEQKEADAG